MRVLYANLAQVLGEIEVDSSTDPPTTSERNWIVDTVLPHVSERIEQLTSKEYAPRLRVRKFDAFGDHIDDLYNALMFTQTPLLEVEGLTVGGTTLDAEDYLWLDDDSPYWRIGLAVNAPVEWATYDADWRRSIELEGVWGYRTDYPLQGWRLSGTSVNDNPLNSSATTVTAVNGAFFSPGDMIRMDDEWCLVGNVSSNNLTVERGVRGSTAASHTQGTAIHIWSAQPQIVRAALRWAAFLYRNRGNFSVRKFDALGGTVVEQLPADAPQEVQNILRPFAHEALMRSGD